MTQYSISAEEPTQKLFNLTTDTSPSEVEFSDWESRMARLVGFEEASPSTKLIEPEDSDNPLESPLSEPQETPSEQSLSSNPFAKLGLVGGATLAVVLVAGVFLSLVMNSGNKKPINNITSEVRQPTTQSRSQTLEGEVETLKTKLALSEQAELVKDAQQKLRNPKPTIVSSPQTISRPVQTASVPRTLTVERVVRVPIPQQTPIAIAPSLPVVKPNIQPAVTITPPAKPDPLEEWAKLAKLGSYGQVNVTVPANNVQAQVPQQPPNPSPNPQPQQPTVVSQEKQQTPKSVPVGTSAKAVLATAVFGETTRSRNNNNNNNTEKEENKNVFVVKLREPLKAKDGTPVLPANTELLAEVSSISEQGLIQLNVVKVILQNNGNLTERSLPQNAIAIRAPQGKPLLASQFPNQSSSIIGMDLGVAALGAIGKGAELINRPDSQIVPITNTSVTGGVTSSTTTTTIIQDQKRNIGAGLLEGAANTIVPQISQRNQQAISQMMQKTNLWYMAAGTNIEIYFNQPMQF